MRSFYAENQGAVLSTSINQYMYISSHKFFEEGQIRAKYSQTETVNDVSLLKHSIIRVVLEKFKVRGGLEVSSIADVPAGTGLGSSSSFTVGLLHNLYARTGESVSKETLADEACNIEIDVLKEPIGKQDQYATAYGGLNIIKFNSDDTVHVEPVILPKDALHELESNLLMFYTGDQRNASSILTEQKQNTAKRDKAETLKEMVSLVWELRDALSKVNLERFGEMLHRNWLLKQKLASGISNDSINSLYETAMKNGATGGKLLGAGGGGFLLFYCYKKYHERLKSAMQPLRCFDFAFEQEGSKVIYIGE
ncbi:MAG: GHMP kinase [Patescibacteria group bacterium]